MASLSEGEPSGPPRPTRRWGRHTACAGDIGRVGAGRPGGRSGGAVGAPPHSPPRHQAGPGTDRFRPPRAAPQGLRDRPRRALADRREGGDRAGRRTPCCRRRVILLARPGPQRLADSSAQDLLVRCWRLLFHARVHLVLEAKVACGRALGGDGPRADWPAWSGRVRRDPHGAGAGGHAAAAAERLSVYVEFAATYLELRHFAPSFLPRYFPGLEDFGAVDALLREDVDAEGLFAATRPSGAGDPHDPQEWDQWADLPPEQASRRAAKPSPPRPPWSLPGSRYRVLMRKSQRPASLGNVVRAAICHARAARCAPPELAARAEAAVKADVHRLAAPAPGGPGAGASAGAALGGIALGLGAADAARHLDRRGPAALRPAKGLRGPRAGRVHGGRGGMGVVAGPAADEAPPARPARRADAEAPAERRAAVGRGADFRAPAAAARPAAPRRDRARSRRGSGEQLRPRIVAALDDVGLLPQNLPERVARKKLVEELLDRIVDRGSWPSATCGTRSRGTTQTARPGRAACDFPPRRPVAAGRPPAGDWRLDGVYRRGEIYLRWMQRLSSPGFGTGIGRFLTRFAVVPFGGAFVTVARHAWSIWELDHRPIAAEEEAWMISAGS